VWCGIGLGKAALQEEKEKIADDTNEEVVGRVAIRANTDLCLAKETSMDWSYLETRRTFA